ncbi:MCE family protein, partial [Enterococcus hirae]
ADRVADTARVEAVSGRLVNDNGKSSGVTVGKVTGIRVDDGGAALVTFEVDRAAEVPEDSTVEMRWRATFGLRFLYVNTGESDVLAAGDG